MEKSELFRKLPSVDELLRAPALISLAESYGTASVTDSARIVLSRLREEIASGLLDTPSLKLALQGVESAIEAQLRRSLSFSLQPVINATGVILHTNLGRAPLSEAALDHIRDTARHYSNLEFNLESGERGKRDVHVDRLFRKLLTVGANSTHASTATSAVPQGQSPADLPQISTIVVNNNAAAVLLALNTLAEGGEVIVSRGELVEIGGSFRIPDVMAKSGATLREVGTTNRTRVSDYENAINERTRLLLRVHRSNFEITGFTEQPSTAELVDLARKKNLPLMEDLGSGARRRSAILRTPRRTERSRQPACRRRRGHLQRRQVAGRPAGRIAQRACRSDRAHALQLAVSRPARGQADLRRTRSNAAGVRETGPRCDSGSANDAPDARKRSEHVPRRLAAKTVPPSFADGDCRRRVRDRRWRGAFRRCFRRRLLAVTLRPALAPTNWRHGLRNGEPPIIARVEDGRVLLDLRTVFPEQDQLIADALRQIAIVRFPHRIARWQPSTPSDTPRARSTELIAALQAHQIQTLVDIRAFPMSRRLPHFNRDSLGTDLACCRTMRYVVDERHWAAIARRFSTTLPTSRCATRAFATMPTTC